MTTINKEEILQQKEISTEDKLKALYNLQKIHSKIDGIRILRGELPLEVQDLEDEVEGILTRITKLKEEVKELDKLAAEKKILMQEAKTLIKKYQEQQRSARNDREFESLDKEIEFQQLEVQLLDKKMKEAKAKSDARSLHLDQAKENYARLKEELKIKKGELDEIIAETKKDEDELLAEIANYDKLIEPRLLSAYKRIRQGARNGLAVVGLERNACGGCYHAIPPQIQVDIRSMKKVVVCEHCGRILVDYIEEL